MSGFGGVLLVCFPIAVERVSPVDNYVPKEQPLRASIYSGCLRSSIYRQPFRIYTTHGTLMLFHSSPK